MEPANIFYLIVSLIMVIGDTAISMYPGRLYLILLGVLLICRLVTFLIYDNKRHFASQKTGKAKYMRATKATLKGSRIEKNDLELNTEVSGESLCIGDVVRLKKYEIAPCDCIVLAASDKKHTEYICYVDNTIQDGTLKRIEKHSLELTRSFTPLTFKETTARQFMKRLTGKIDVYPYDRVNMKFRGSIKLKSDPKVEELTNKNLLTKGSIIRSRFCYALVVSTGEDCSTLSYSNIEKGKRSSIHKTVNVFSIIAISLNLLISLVSIMTLFVRTQGNTILKNVDPNLANGLRIFTFFILYCPIVPLSMLVMIEISNVLYARRLEANYRNFTSKPDYHTFLASDGITRGKTGVNRLVTKIEGQDGDKEVVQTDTFDVLNANVLPDLGCAEHIFFDKTGTLVTPDYEIITVSTNSKLYKSEDNNFLNDNILREISDYNNSKTFGYKGDDDEDSGVFSEGSRRSQVSNPDYNFTIKMHENNPLSAQGSKVKNTEEDQLLGQIKPKNSKTKSKKKSKMTGFGGKKNGILYKIYDEFDFFKDTVRDAEVNQMMEMFTLCHNSVPSGNTFESNSIVEKAMLLFSKNFNYNFSVDKFQKSKTLEAGGIMKHYRIKGSEADDKTVGVNIYIINQFDDDRKRFSVLVGKEGQSGATLYVRGINDSMNDLIDFGDENQKSYNEVIKYNELTGLSTYVFAKRELNATLT